MNKNIGIVVIILCLMMGTTGCDKEKEEIVNRTIEIETGQALEGNNSESERSLEYYYKELKKAEWGDQFDVPDLAYLKQFDDVKQPGTYEEYSTEVLYQFYNRFGGDAEGLVHQLDIVQGGIIFSQDDPIAYEWEMDESLIYRLMVLIVEGEEEKTKLQIETKSGEILWEESNIDESNVFYFQINGKAAKECMLTWISDGGKERENGTDKNSQMCYILVPLLSEEVERVDGGSEILVP